MFNKSNLREKTGESYPPFLWIISTLMGITGAYFSRIGSAYYVLTDSILLISAWLIFIGLLVIFLSFNDWNEHTIHNRTGVYSAINHPKLFGEYLLIIGLSLQAINLVMSVLLIILFSLYHKWLLNPTLKGQLSPISYFRFNILKMKNNDDGIQISKSYRHCIPYLLYSIIYILIEMELRNRSIGRSLLDYLKH